MHLTHLTGNLRAICAIDVFDTKLDNQLDRLPQQAQTIESVSGHTYIRKRISLTFFVKKLILWSEGLSQCFLSDPALFVCKAITFFNEIDLHPHNSYHPRNTIKLIRRSSSIIDEYIYSVRLHDIW
jgi:hypothetical protein